MKRITAAEVGERLAQGDPLVFVDSRNPQAWAESDVMVPGAIRVAADAVDENAGVLPQGRPIVAYCT